MHKTELIEKLKEDGFSVVEVGVGIGYYSVHVGSHTLYAGDVKTGKNQEVGEVRLTYDFVNLDRIEDVLKLRDFLDKEGILYIEHPPRAEAAQLMRKKAEDMKDLAERVFQSSA